MTRLTSSLAQLAVLGAGVVFGACSDVGTPRQGDVSPAVGPSAIPEDLNRSSNFARASTGDLVPVAIMEAQMAAIAHDVAITLADPGTRSRVFDALHSSPFKEHKLRFRTVVQNDQVGLGGALAQLRGSSAADVLSRLDSVADLEFYMPVPGHWRRWTKSSDLIVVSYPNDDGAVPHGYNLQGEEVRLSSESPPDTPMLVLTATETDFESPRSLRSYRPDAQAMTMLDDPVTGGHWLMSYLSINDVKEPFYMGSPEIEIHTFFEETSGEWTDRICAGGDRAAPYYFDMNGTSWSGSVTLATENFIGENVIEYQVWEDDNDPCAGTAGGRPPKTTSNINLDLQNLSTRALSITLNLPNPPYLGAKWILVAANNIDPTLDVVSSLQKDDFIGIMDGPEDSCWPIYDDPVFPIKDDDGFHRGWGSVDPTYGEKVPECDPTSVRLDGPVNVCDSQSSAQFFADAEGAGPFQFTWKVDGATQYGATTETFQWTGFTIGPYNIEVEMLDTGSMIQVSDDMTSHVVDC